MTMHIGANNSALCQIRKLIRVLRAPPPVSCAARPNRYRLPFCHLWFSDCSFMTNPFTISICSACALITNSSTTVHQNSHANHAESAFNWKTKERKSETTKFMNNKSTRFEFPHFLRFQNTNRFSITKTKKVSTDMMDMKTFCSCSTVGKRILR